MALNRHWLSIFSNVATWLRLTYMWSLWHNYFESLKLHLRSNIGPVPGPQTTRVTLNSKRKYTLLDLSSIQQSTVLLK